jgi:hypothetical protein
MFLPAREGFMNADELVKKQVMRKDGDLEAKIRARAHEIWEHEGRPAGRAEAHWEQARREIEFDAARSKPAEHMADSGSASSFAKSRGRKRAI